MYTRVTTLFAALLFLISTTGPVKAQSFDDAESYNAHFLGVNGGGGFGEGFVLKSYGAAEQGEAVVTGNRPLQGKRSFTLRVNGPSPRYSGVAVSRSFDTPLSGLRMLSFRIRFNLDVGRNALAGVSLNETAAAAQTNWNDGQKLAIGSKDGIWKVNGRYVRTSNGTPFSVVTGDVYLVQVGLDLDKGVATVQVKNQTSRAQRNPSAPLTVALNGSPEEVIRSISFGHGSTGPDQSLSWDEVSLSGYLAHLPVELTSFDAVMDGGRVRLAWATASETNNAGFAVEHASESADFAEIGFVGGHGTTIEARQYTHGVEGLTPGTHRFRLRQVDFDGTFAYSPVVEVSVGVPGQFILEPAYPNPFNPESTVRFAVSETQPVRVELYNAAGQQVDLLYEGAAPAGEMQTVRVDGSALPSGLYLVRVTGTQFVALQKLSLVK